MQEKNGQSLLATPAMLPARTVHILGLLLAMVIYIAVRILILSTDFDRVAIPSFELFGGTVAKLLIEGPSPSLNRFYDNSGGDLFTPFAAIPFFALFDDSYLTLKLVPATMGFLILVLLWTFLRENFGQRAAFLGALLFALGPVPLLIQWSLLAGGKHFEHLFFLLLLFTAFYRCHGRRRLGRGQLFLLGFLAGFELFLFLGSLVPIGLLALVHLGVRGWRQSLRDLTFVAPGAVLGFSPFVALNLLGPARGIGFLKAKFGAAGSWDLSRVASRFWEYLANIPAAASYPDVAGISAGIPNGLVTGILLAAWILVLPLALQGVRYLLQGALRSGDSNGFVFERAKLVPFVLYLPATAVAFSLGNFRVGGHFATNRYYLPLTLFGVILLAALSAAKPRWRERAGVALGVLACVAGWGSVLSLELASGRTGYGAQYAGYSFAQISRVYVSVEQSTQNADAVKLARQLPAQDRGEFLRGLGYHLATLELIRTGQRGPSSGELNLESIITGFPPAHHEFLLVGAGSRLASEPEADALLRAVRVQTTRDPVAARSLLSGAGGLRVFVPKATEVPWTLQQRRRLLARLDPSMRIAFLEGLGRMCGQLLSRRIPSEQRLVREYASALGLSDEEWSAYDRGVRRGLAPGASDQAGT